MAAAVGLGLVAALMPADHASAQARASPGAARQVGPAACGVLRRPVDAAVSDPFRLPAGPYGPGNRGLEYATVPGQPVRAVEAGVVRFAGRIGWAWYVTVDLGGGLSATFSHLGSVEVATGEAVVAGTVVGLTGPSRFHFGLRRGGEYLDPAPLLDTARRPRLIPDRRFGQGPACRP